MISLSSAFYYRAEIFKYIKTKDVTSNLGEAIKQDFVVFDSHGNKTNFHQLFNQPLVVMVFSESCAPCREAIKVIAKHLEISHKSEIRRKFVVLEFDEEQSDYLTSFTNINYYRTYLSRSSTIFTGWSTPTFYLFDKTGKLESKVVGWHTVSYPDMFK
ncbi:MAG: hypothetical protein L3J53_01195 [Proteobacteria bacterium]|nr:hypothetical protein [Pseudomonadota bacterium]